jgi:hypothetical protein
VISGEAATAVMVRFGAGDGGEGQFGRKEGAHDLIGFGRWWRLGGKTLKTGRLPL